MKKKTEEKSINSNRCFSMEVVLAPLPPNEIFRRSERLKTLLFQGALNYARNKQAGQKTIGKED
jgi:hypothetical protein